MKRKLEISELIFKIISYVLLTAFALCCLYPFVYAASSSISGRRYVNDELFEMYEPVKVPDGTGDVFLVNEDEGIRLKAVTDDKGEIVSAQIIEGDGSTTDVTDAVRGANGGLAALQVLDGSGKEVTDADGAPVYAAVIWFSKDEGIGLQDFLNREMVFVDENKTWLKDPEYLSERLETVNQAFQLKIAKVKTANGKPVYNNNSRTTSKLAVACENALAAGTPVSEIIPINFEKKTVLIPKSDLDSSIPEGAAVVRNTERRGIVLLPKGIQFRAFSWMFQQDVFWNSYSNTLFLTVYGTVWALVVSILGAYALSKKRLKFRKFFNFFLVFTMWFSAGIVPQKLNYDATKMAFHGLGVMDDKWMVVIAMGMAAMNIILLRNAFENVPGEIEEAAVVDGATEMQVLRQVFIPMSKSTIATVALFFAISRWNGYFWAKQMVTNQWEWPLQVYIRNKLDDLVYDSEIINYWNEPYAISSVIYALIVCSIIPILIIYPFIQKYFAKGTNVGGVKE